MLPGRHFHQFLAAVPDFKRRLDKVHALRKVATAATVVTESMSTDSLEREFGAKEGAMSKQVYDMSTSGAFAKRYEEDVMVVRLE